MLFASWADRDGWLWSGLVRCAPHDDYCNGCSGNQHEYIAADDIQLVVSRMVITLEVCGWYLLSSAVQKSLWTWSYRHRGRRGLLSFRSEDETRDPLESADKSWNQRWCAFADNNSQSGCLRWTSVGHLVRECAPRADPVRGVTNHRKVVTHSFGDHGAMVVYHMCSPGGAASCAQPYAERRFLESSTV